jgi:hypothetical protein
VQKNTNGLEGHTVPNHVLGRIRDLGFREQLLVNDLKTGLDVLAIAMIQKYQELYGFSVSPQSHRQAGAIKVGVGVAVMCVGVVLTVVTPFFFYGALLVALVLICQGLFSVTTGRPSNNL